MLACGHRWTGKSIWALGPTNVHGVLCVFVCERVSGWEGWLHAPGVCLVWQSVLSLSGAGLFPAVHSVRLSVRVPTGSMFSVKCAPLVHHFVFSAGGASAPAALPLAQP